MMPGSFNEAAPLFSIITPTFRRPELLKRNTKSVREQTFRNYEHIIVDDGNDSATAELVRELSDDKIIFIRHETGKGAAGSYNTGIQRSRGQLILFLDDDDEYMPSFLEKMHSAFSAAGKDTGFIWSGIARIKDEPGAEKLICNLVWPEVFKAEDPGFAAATSVSNGFGVCVRRECIEAIGMYDEKMEVGEDTDFMFRLAQKYNYRTIPEVLVRVHQHNLHQLTSAGNSQARINGKELILDRYKDVLLQRPVSFSAHYYGYAALCYSSGEKAKGRKAMFAIIKMRPFMLMTYADLISLELFEATIGNTAAGKMLKRMIRKLANN